MAQTYERERLRYAPGDGYVYAWDGGPWITVSKVTYEDGVRREVLTPDVIPAPATRTGTQLCAAVNEWRLAQ
jgi:hypothetical protein